MGQNREGTFCAGGIVKQKHLDLIAKQNELEKQGLFDVNIVPPNVNTALPMTKDYKYIRDNHLCRAIGMTISWLVNTFYFGLKIKGRKNLRELKGKGAIVICNHVSNLDNAMVRQAAFGRRLYTTVGWFNNRNDIFGKLMRGAGCLPIPNPDGADAMRLTVSFGNAIKHCLEKNDLVLFYPEQSLWWRYEKQRPFKDGAFYFASKHNVPVVPMFITWRKNKKYATIHVLKPIYPDGTKERKENTEFLKQASYDSIKNEVLCKIEFDQSKKNGH